MNGEPLQHWFVIYLIGGNVAWLVFVPLMVVAGRHPPRGFYLGGFLEAAAIVLSGLLWPVAIPLHGWFSVKGGK